MDENGKTNDVINTGYPEYSVHFKSPVSPPANTYASYISQYILYLFSKIYTGTIWLLGLRWYKILFLVIVGLISYVMMESIIEQRKENRKKRKEGMQSNQGSKSNVKVKSIMQKKTEKKTNNRNKKVKFNINEKSATPDIYDLVMIPSIYSFFRSIGFR